VIGCALHPIGRSGLGAERGPRNAGRAVLLVGGETTRSTATGSRLAALGGAVREAWRESCLGDVTSATADVLVEDSRLVRLSAGEPFQRERHAADRPTLALMVDGLVRIYRRGIDGRQVTVRYVTAGGLIGLATVLGASPVPAPLGAASLDAEALRDSTALRLCPARFGAAIAEDPALASALCRYLFHELVEAQDTLAGDLLSSVRSRVACHLLNLAERQDRELVVRATPQRLAASVGSVREVVSRVLRHMEQLGLLQRRAGQLVLVDSAGLHRVWAGESGI
jgi:CRP/FNR family transcriptional regulator, cyclic AMP receptor protein